MIVLCGKTGSGKDTISKELLNLGYQKAINCTTRPMRDGEVDGREYYFVTDEEFDKLLNNGAFLETTKYSVANGETWRYGTLLVELKKTRSFAIMNPDGVKEILKHPEYEPVIFYLYADDALRMRRLQNRGDNFLEIQRRMKSDDKDFSEIDDYFDFVVPNNTSSPRMVAEYITYEYERNLLSENE